MSSRDFEIHFNMEPPRWPLVIKTAVHYFPLPIPECFTTEEQRQHFISTIADVTFIPTLKALCAAALGNASRKQQVSRVDPCLDQLFNKAVKYCQSSHAGRPGWRWTAFPTLLVKKRKKPTTRHGPHYHIIRQCFSCWVRDRDPGMPCKQKFKIYT